MTFRAKCRITGVHAVNSHAPKPDRTMPIDSMTVTLQPVFAGSDGDANKEWSKWTPMRLTITNPEIYPELVNGRAFYVDFTPVEG